MGRTNEKKQGILFFEEGYAERYLYVRIVNHLMENSKCKYKIMHKNLKGEGNTREIPNYYRLKASGTGVTYTVFFCYDTDVWERTIGKHPSVRWDEARRELRKLEVQKIHDIKQCRSIEDILLGDKAGIISYLGLPANPKLSGTGDVALSRLYKQAGKVYAHSNCQMMEKLINALDIKHIIAQSEHTFHHLLAMFPDYIV